MPFANIPKPRCLSLIRCELAVLLRSFRFLIVRFGRAGLHLVGMRWKTAARGVLSHSSSLAGVSLSQPPYGCHGCANIFLADSLVLSGGNMAKLQPLHVVCVCTDPACLRAHAILMRLHARTCSCIIVRLAFTWLVCGDCILNITLALRKRSFPPA